MVDPNSPSLGIDVDSLHRVSDPDQAAVIADPTRSAYLVPFLGRENTVTQAAAEVGCSPGAMLYRVRRMHDLGILTIVRTDPRGGRGIKVYRSVHDGYFVPTEVMHYDDVRHRIATHSRVLVTDLIDSYVAVLADADHSGRAIARNHRGGVWGSDLLPHANRRGQPAYFGDVKVRLTKDEAGQVRALLDQAMDRATLAARAHTGRAQDDEPARHDPDRPERYLFVGAILPL